MVDNLIVYSEQDMSGYADFLNFANCDTDHGLIRKNISPKILSSKEVKETEIYQEIRELFQPDFSLLSSASAINSELGYKIRTQNFSG